MAHPNDSRSTRPTEDNLANSSLQDHRVGQGQEGLPQSWCSRGTPETLLWVGGWPWWRPEADKDRTVVVLRRIIPTPRHLLPPPPAPAGCPGWAGPIQRPMASQGRPDQVALGRRAHSGSQGPFPALPRLSCGRPFLSPAPSLAGPQRRAHRALLAFWSGLCARRAAASGASGGDQPVTAARGAVTVLGMGLQRQWRRRRVASLWVAQIWAGGYAAPHLRRLSQLLASPALASAERARGSGRAAGVLALRLLACLLQLALLREQQRMLKAAPQLVASARVRTCRWLPSLCREPVSQQQLGNLRLLWGLLLLGLQAQCVLLSS